MESFMRLIRSQWDRVAAVVAAIVGAVALVLGWIGVSGKGLPAEQIPYLVSGAIFGVFAIGIAATLWLSADLRDEWRKLDDIHQALRSLESSESSENGTGAGGESDPVISGWPTRRDPIESGFAGD
jgi:hypothetical protein